MRRYFMLMASLPPLSSPFGAEQTPISRLRLERRLRMLHPEDADELAAIEGLMHWHRLSFDITDREIVERIQRLLPAIRSPMLRRVVEFRIEVRTLVAALRRRAAGDRPPVGEVWGWGRWVRHLERNWDRPAFGLAGLLPWLAELESLLAKGETLAFERALLGHVWKELCRAAEGHYFDFEAVVLYVMRWDLVHRWLSYDGDRGHRRFTRLAADVLAASTVLATGSP